MDVHTTRPIEEIDKLRYAELIKNKAIEVSPHALDHLSEKQRKVYKEQDLIQMVEKETPRRFYLQRNGRYAGYYRKSDGYRKLVLEIEQKGILIITFMDVLEIPRVNIENE